MKKEPLSCKYKTKLEELNEHCCGRLLPSDAFFPEILTAAQQVQQKGGCMITLVVNDKTHDVDVSPEMPLLWALRDVIGLTGTKYGCGMALCGACTVHIDGEAVRSCVFPVSAAVGKKIVTIEGLAANGDHPVQKAWIAHQVPQCGYCQSGMIMATAALLKKNPKPTDADIDAEITNICRCGTYARIRTAIHDAAKNA
jgi:aerobic-type carbon monoxide dehydrogenase small subunit (CoxS/CutS family)